MNMMRKLRQLWCYLRHDHMGVTLSPDQRRYRCKVCGYEGNIW